MEALHLSFEQVSDMTMLQMHALAEGHEAIQRAYVEATRSPEVAAKIARTRALAAQMGIHLDE